MGSPTVADDVLLIDPDPTGLQSLLNIAKAEFSRKMYSIHPVKSEVSSARGIPHDLLLGNKNMSYVKTLNHLGLSRSMKASNTEVVSERITAAAKTFYALMPSGLHGENWITPHASRKINTAYILPRLIYGLEAIVVGKSELANLGRAYKRLLKSLLGLRDGIADEAVFMLFGLLPI